MLPCSGGAGPGPGAPAPLGRATTPSAARKGCARGHGTYAATVGEGGKHQYSARLLPAASAVASWNRAQVRYTLTRKGEQATAALA